MSKLLRFKGSPSSATDVYGFGKQPIYVPPKSAIALKNFNIRLKSVPDNSLYRITTESNSFQYGLTGDARDTTLPPGDYRIDGLVNALTLSCNNIPDQDSGVSTGVSFNSTTGKLNFRTFYYTPDNHDLSDTNIFNSIAVGGALTLGAGIYDATATTSADGQLETKVLRTSDYFSAKIVAIGNGFEFFLDESGDNLYGVGYDAANYLVWLDGNEIRLAETPGVDDTFSMARSGTKVQIAIAPLAGGGARYTYQLQTSTLERVLEDTTVYLINSVGGVSLDTINFCFLGLSGFNSQVDFVVPTQSLADTLGLAAPGTVTSPAGNPTILVPVNDPIGNVIYSGIMVCLTGLDLESYDFATEAQGKVNYIYTINNNSAWNATSITANRAIGDVANEVYVEMNNETAVNINNKLSVFLLDTASGQKLQFEYCDLLLIIRP